MYTCFLKIITNTALFEGILITAIRGVLLNATVPSFNTKHNAYCLWAGELQQPCRIVPESPNISKFKGILKVISSKYKNPCISSYKGRVNEGVRVIQPQG